MSTVIVTEDNFNNEICASEIPVLVDFWAGCCDWCEKAGPVLDEISDELQGKLKIARINVNEEPVLAYKYKVCSVPTMLLFREGKVTDSFRGSMTKKQIQTILNVSMMQ